MNSVRSVVALAATTSLSLTVLALGAPGATAVPAPAAGPHPVAPTVHRLALTGVDAAALDGSPAALDPAALAAADQGKAVALGRAAKDRRPTVLTAELGTARFEAAGVSWTAGGSVSDVVVQVRIRERGQWSDWQGLAVADGPDRGSRDTTKAGSTVATEPITTASADALQVRVDTGGKPPPANLQVVTVDPGASAADAPVAAAATAAAAANPAGKPAIVTRAQWGADESLRDCDPTYSSTIKAGIVHHTVNSNNYQPGDSAGLVRAIYAYHVNGNGWCDIGYNFLVDRYGAIFEGRYGGVDRAVIGAHAGGFNTYTFGVSGIGDFTSAQPTAQMLAAYTAVLGWKLSLNGVDPQSTTVLISGGGPYTQWPEGTPVTVRTISGHRDVDATGCPGDAFYPRLNGVASLVRSYIATTSPPTTVLNAGNVKRSPDGRYMMAMQADGNLVVYGPGGATWATNTGVPYAFTAVQGDGNMVMYDRTDGSPLWASNTSGLYAHLEMQNDGNLVLYSGTGVPTWDSQGNTRHSGITFAPNKASVGSLNPGQGRYSPNGAYWLVMQGDGNLVEYGGGRARWASNTGVPGARAVLQADGNFVVYSPQNQALWASGSSGNPGAWAAVHNDGRLAVYRTNGTAAWVG